ncbi:MAG TPA: 2-oxo acid dehydrogenase subunit E2 [Tepidisphaeraceae bacterium]|nr:2-oxo acid dehydrogenase subunit E2 [Tepidisphaeraceae bacterium]
MSILRLPKEVAGFKAASATVCRWLKAQGQSFAKGEPIVELDSVDSLIQIEAAESGTLTQIIAAPHATVLLGADLAEFTSGNSSPEAQVSHPTQGVAAMSTSAPTGKVTPILMPQAGNTMEEGRIVKWIAKAGDRIAVGQVICEIETDKATIEFESTDAGRLARIVAKEGDVVAVKQPIALLAESDSDLQSTGSASAVASAPAPSKPTAKPPTGKVVPVLMPQVGNSMEEGTIIKWHVKPGDVIKLGQIIFEIDTDKASVEIEATQEGRLSKIVQQVGAVVPIKQPVAFIADNDADVDAYLESGDTPAAVAAPIGGSATQAVPVNSSVAAPAARSGDGRVKASPAARKLAAERGLDLSTVATGSGPGGRILTTDLAHASQASTAKSATPSATTTGVVVRKPMSKMRKAIATNLQVSKQTIPHFYVRLTINADPLFAFYRAQKPATGCTLNDVVLLAIGKTISEFPAFRSRLEGNDIVEYPNSNIAVAVSVEDGLVVPVLMTLERHSLSTLPAESRRVVENARKGKLENIGKAVFTISNMGMLGVEDFSAIINPPESGILAISAVREDVIVKDGAIRAGKVMSMTLSVDHRVVDGALAATFMAKLKERLEKPESLLA